MNELIIMLKEVFLFNIFETMMLVFIYMTVLKIELKIRKYIFHVIMFAIMNYIIPVFIPIPIVPSIIIIVIMSAYYMVIYKNSFKVNFMTNIVAFAICMTIEMCAAIIYIVLLGIPLNEMSNDFQKFIIIIPLRISELIIFWIYFKNNFYIAIRGFITRIFKI